MALDDYNSNPDLNTSISGININEGCPPSNINNAIRQLMADLKNKIVLATTSIAGLMSAADKTKLNGIATGANNYVHPTTAGNKHIPAGGSSGQILRWSAAGTAAWGADNNTTYSNFVKSGSSAAAGLVPKPPTTAGTSKYLREDGTWTVPPDHNTTYGNATNAASGLVKIGSNITVSNGTISLTKANVTTALGYTPPMQDTNTTYSNFGKATSNAGGTSGLVPAPGAGKQNSYLRGDGTWSVPPAYTHPSYTARTGVPTGNQTPGFGGTFQVNQVTCDNTGHVTAVTARTVTIPATKAGASTLGLVQVGSNIGVDNNGKISVADATTSAKGVVKIGSNISVSSGTISVPAASASSNGVVTTGPQTFAGEKTFAANTVFNLGATLKGNTELRGEIGAYEQNTGFQTEILLEKSCTLLRGTTYVGLYDGLAGKWIVRVNDGDGTNDSYWHYGTVKTVSDKREKTDIAAVPDEILDAWADVDWAQFRYAKEVKSKGGDALLSIGIVAQMAENALRRHGLEAERYAFLTHERWQADEEHKEAGDKYYISYVDALSIEAAYQRRRADRAEARIARLEEQMQTLLAAQE